MELKISLNYEQILKLVHQLPIDQKRKLQSEIEESLQAASPPPEKAQREFGVLKGKVWMADDFDAPLDDFKDYL